MAGTPIYRRAASSTSTAPLLCVTARILGIGTDSDCTRRAVDMSKAAVRVLHIALVDDLSCVPAQPNEAVCAATKRVIDRPCVSVVCRSIPGQVAIHSTRKTIVISHHS
jgi:hypothetical protein